ncbi:uncharacterized protein LOC122254423 [Penaeus japonicus]|uniref:uncharacterized protein LOC122254423 n=1 Tax=Penaeus japonicus TaxID=27405 RepID=UPI001C70B898|nr:uncharacterized protein LOC122254423 [Penaeus japonicus]
MCPGWWVGRGCLLGVLLLLLLLLAGGAPAPAAPSTTPGASGAPPYRSKAPPQHQQHSAGGAPWVPRARRPPSTSAEPERVTPAAPTPPLLPPFPGTQVLPPLEPSPTAPPGVTASDQSLMVRNTRSTASNNTKNFRHHHKYRQQLYNDNARCVLKLCTNGTVQATSNLSDPHTLLHLRPIDGGGFIEIRSEATGLFLCMNKKGNLYASCNRSSECEFMKTIEDNFYDTLQSRQFLGRYIAIAVNGRIKRARRVRGPLGKEHYFLPRNVEVEKVRRIIQQYQQALGPTPSQRCDGHNEYNMTGVSGSSHDTRGRGSSAPPAGTTRPASPPGTTTTTTTTAKPKTPHRRCSRIDARRKKCRKRHRKRCKTKKCRDRRRKRKKGSKKERGSNRRRSRERTGESDPTTEAPEATTAAERQEERAKAVPSRPRYRHGANASRTHQRAPRRRKPTPVARRLRHYRLSTPSPSSPVSLSPLSAHKPTRSPAQPWVVTLTPSHSQPFPTAPSSAPTHHVRHAHSGRRRRPRGPLTPPTSTTA